MNTLSGTAPTGAPSPVLLPGPSDAKLAWRRRVSRVGSLIQLGFAALWLARGTLATGWTGRLPLGLALVAGAVALGVWGEARTRGLAPRPSEPGRPAAGVGSRRLPRSSSSVSFGLPFVVIALGRPDLVSSGRCLSPSGSFCSAASGEAPDAGAPGGGRPPVGRAGRSRLGTWGKRPDGSHEPGGRCGPRWKCRRGLGLAVPRLLSSP